MKKAIWFKNFPAGRFANVVFQYAFIKYITSKLNIPFYLGDDTPPESYSAQNLLDFKYNYTDLDLNDVDHKIISLSGERLIHPSVELKLIADSLINFSGVIQIDGYFQFDTNFLDPTTEYGQIFKSFIFPCSDGNTFQKLLYNYQNTALNKFHDTHLIAIHIRLGDYLIHEKNDDPNINPFYTINFNYLLSFLNNYINLNRIKKYAIYIASDDINYCISKFQSVGLDVYTRNDLFNDQAENDDYALVQDVAVLSSSNFTVCSNSSFSILSAILNEQNPTLIRYAKDGTFLPFQKFNTVVLYGY